MPHAVRIAASILSADFSRLGEEVQAIDMAGSDWVHVDIMDGHFVPNITFGPAIVGQIRGRTRKPFDVHLMISPVDFYLPDFAKAGANGITVHAEAGRHLDRSLEAIRGLGKRAGVALNPATPVSAVEHVLDRLDLILVMTVNPGFGGQAFITAMLEKVRQAKALIGGRDIDIEVDGGVGRDNAAAAVSAGATVLVAGASVFQGGPARYAENITAIRRAADSVTGRLA